MTGSGGVETKTITSTTRGCYDVCHKDGGEVVTNKQFAEWQAFLGGYVTEEIAPGYHCFFTSDHDMIFEKVRLDDYLVPPSQSFDPNAGYAQFIDFGCYLSGGEIRAEYVNGSDET